MKLKKILFVFIIFCTLFSVLALKVAVDEIKTDSVINFINYQGRYRYQDSAWSIRSIGTKLSKFENDNEFFNYLMKYSIIHAVDDVSSDKYDADVFSIDKDARVDHVRNVRLIISSFLEKRYGYLRSDAYILAIFITYYNAINKGDIDYFSLRYKDVVLRHVNSENIGMSTNYIEWPGNTKIIIPLTENAGEKKLTSLITDELTNEKIIDELKKREDKGVEEREDIVDLKEREIEETKKDIEEEKKEVEKEKEIIVKEEEKIVKEKEEVAKIEDKEEREKKEAEIKEKEKVIAEKKEDVKKAEEKVKKDEVKVVKREETVKKEKADLKSDKKEVQIKKEPEKFVKELEKKEDELVKKEEELKKKEEKLKGMDENIFQDKFYYLKIKEYMNDGHYNNEMFIIDAISRKVLVTSPLINICGSKYDIFKEGVVVISFISDHNSAHNLTLLDLNTLEPKATGTDNIFWRSFVEIKDDFIYAIIKEKENYYLGKYNKRMERVAKSSEKIDSSTFITFYKDYIYINGDKKKDILVLNNKDLSLIDKITP